MKIEKIQINGFGKLENLQIELADKWNIIYGKNESGKSTLLKFILAMFYGISRSKAGKTISDLEKYTPWGKEEFSGKIRYSLENGESYEIFREFQKKNPKIFNEALQEISSKYSMDKTTGIRFFEEQTKINEELFLTTLVSEQEKVKLEDKEQSTLVQRMSNLVTTGEDTVSMQKIRNVLAKKQLEEVGTLRSQDRPINLVDRKLEQIYQEKIKLQQKKERKIQIEQQQQQLRQEIQENQKEIEVIKQIKKIQEEERIQTEKLQEKKQIQEEFQKNISELQKQIEEIEKRNDVKARKKVHPIRIGFVVIGILVAIGVGVLLDKTVGIGIFSGIMLYTIELCYKHNRNKKLIQQEQKANNVEKRRLKNELEELEKRIRRTNKEKRTRRKSNSNQSSRKIRRTKKQ